MASYKMFLKSGHPPTLFAAFLYFDFCFAVWVLNGAMGPFISEQFHLTPGADWPDGLDTHPGRRVDALSSRRAFASTSAARTRPSSRWRASSSL